MHFLGLHDLHQVGLDFNRVTSLAQWMLVCLFIFQR